MTDRQFFDVGYWSEFTPEEKRQVSKNISAMIRQGIVGSIPVRFDPEVYNAAKTADVLQNHLVKEITFLDEFSIWQIEHQINQFLHFAKCQLEGTHELARVLDGVAVCTCGQFDDNSDHIN
jgi:hypothetical protein